MTFVYIFVTKTFASIEFCNSFVTVLIARYKIISFSVFIRMFYYQDTNQNATEF